MYETLVPLGDNTHFGMMLTKHNTVPAKFPAKTAGIINSVDHFMEMLQDTSSSAW